MYAPICKALAEHTAKNYIKFHTGSRASMTAGEGSGAETCADTGAGTGAGLGGGLPNDFRAWDFTELPGLDDLHCPTGVILEAQNLAAEAFGADRTFFSVNGSTAAILALVLGSCKPGDTLVVDRGSHKAVCNALVLADVKAMFVDVVWEDDIAVMADGKVFLDAAIATHAVGVLVTRPHYYGSAADLTVLAQGLHEVGKFLLVDEAHGTHFGFHPLLPRAALQFGADGVAQSAHKTLGALNQTAFLHVKGKLLDAERIGQALSMVQTTSPSYPLLASLDYSRAWLEKEGVKRYEELISATAFFWERLRPPFRMAYTAAMQDPTRLAIRTEGLDGNAVAAALRKEFGIQVEMSEPRYVVCIAVPGDEQALMTLAESLNQLVGFLAGQGDANASAAPAMARPMSAGAPSPHRTHGPLDLRAAFYAKHARVAAMDAVGKVSGDFVTPYPPGVPLLCPGEIISEETAQLICDIISSKITIIDDGGRHE